VLIEFLTPPIIDKEVVNRKGRRDLKITEVKFGPISRNQRSGGIPGAGYSEGTTAESSGQKLPSAAFAESRGTA
jgi:hypothetical protein